MSLDLSGLLGTQRAVRVARADYDFARDGGAQYQQFCESEIIPSGSIILGAVTYASTGFTYSGTGYHHWQVNGADVAIQIKTVGRAQVTWINDAAAIVTNADRKIDSYISDAPCTAGVGTCWVFYLPTTG